MSKRKNNGSMPTAAGILLIIAGIIALITWVVAGFILGTVGLGLSMVPGAEGAATILIVCGVIGVILAILTLLGGISALQKKSWNFALAASIIGLFTIGFYFISSILSLIALILIAISKQEFYGEDSSYTGPATSGRMCPNCGRPIPIDAQVCPYCGKDFRPK